MKVNDEKLEKIFEEVFKVEYRKEFKQELKDMLLKEYDKRKKTRFFIRISTLVAACLVLAVVALGAKKFDFFTLKVPNPSYVKTEMEKSFTQQDTTFDKNPTLNSDMTQNSNLSEQRKMSDNNTDKNERDQLRSSTDQTKDSDNKIFSSLPSSKKPENKKATQSMLENPKKSNSATSSAAQKDISNRKTADADSCLPVLSGSKKGVQAPAKDVKVQGGKKASAANGQMKSLDVKLPDLKHDLQTSKNQENLSLKVQEEVVAKSVYVLKEEDLNIDESYILDVLNSVILDNVYSSVYFSLNDTVEAQVYDGYFCFEVRKTDTQFSVYQFSKQPNQEVTVQSVYHKTEAILQKLGIKDYQIFVVPREDGFRADISICFDGYRIFDADSYINYSRDGAVIDGKIYLKSFSGFKMVQIADAKTAAEEFKRRYNLKNVNPSDVSIVYKKAGEVFVPVYIYIYENKIYWLEK